MLAGDLIGGRFYVEAPAGSGAMGGIYRARDQLTGGRAAVKVMNRSSSRSAARFAREAELLASMNHEAIVRYVGHGVTAKGEPFLAMEWIEGETLSQRLARERLTFEETVTLGLRVAQGLAHAHRLGVVHRDVKPSNLVLEGARVEAVKLLDFGIARAPSGKAALTMTGVTLGTPGYMAPEQARGERGIDARADVFSLGCVLFQCLTGQPPFEGPDQIAVLVKTVLADPPRPAQIDAAVPPRLDDLVMRMLAKPVEARPKDASEIVEALSSISQESVGAGSARYIAPVVSSLTESEQRVLCVVLCRRTRDLDHDDAFDDLAAALRAVDLQNGVAEHLAEGSLLVTFAGTFAQRDQVVAAAHCALALSLAFPDARVAVATGRGRLGNDRGASTELRARGSAVGEVVDRAARLLGLEDGPAASRPVRLDEVTAGLLATRFEIGGDALGLTLGGQRETDEAVRTLLGRATRCVGRERELATLDAMFDECVSEPVARAVLITAPPGTGKSRLRHEFIERLRARRTSLQIWIGRGDPMRAGSPFGMIVPILRRIAGLRDGEPPSLGRQKLRARVARHVGQSAGVLEHLGRDADVDRVTSFLAELVGLGMSDDAGVQLRAARGDPKLMGDQMRRAWEDLLAAECAAQPVVLVLEDLHWGDRPSVAFVDAALQALSEAPLMVLALARPEAVTAFPNLWREREAQEIRLGSLGKKASELLVREALGASTSDEVVGRLIERAAGNAFYLEELIRAKALGTADRLPETVLAMVQARLDALEATERRLLRAASVLGQTFWGGAVRALLGTDDARRVDPLLDALVDRELLVRRRDSRFPNHDEYAFRHALVHQAAYAMLTDVDRALGHRLAGEWLERAGERDALALAEHFERGGQPERAVSRYRHAAEQALAGNNLAGALARAERGVACGAAGETLGALRLVQAHAHNWRGEHDEGEACCSEALQLLPAGGAAWFDAAGEAAETCGRLGATDRLVAVAAEVLSRGQAGELGHASVKAVARAAEYLLYAGQYELADSLLAHLPWAEVPGDAPAAIGKLLQARATRATFCGDPSMALHLMRQAAGAFEEAGDAYSALQAGSNVGYIFMTLGAYEEAERTLRDVLARATQLALAHVVAMAKQNLGMTLAYRGAVGEGRAMEAESAEAFRAFGHQRMEGASRIYFTFILMRARDAEDAEREARAAIEVLQGTPPALAVAYAALAEVLLARGRLDAALQASRRAAALADSLGALEDGDILLWVIHAAVLHANADREGALAAIEIACRLIHARADKIGDAALKRSFLEAVPENVRAFALARAWAAPGGEECR